MGTTKVVSSLSELIEQKTIVIMYLRNTFEFEFEWILTGIERNLHICQFLGKTFL